METNKPENSSYSHTHSPTKQIEQASESLQNEVEDAFEKQSEKALHKTRNYNRVQNQVRKELIDRVYKGGESIYESAIQLGIKYSTAKTIVKIYRQEGRIEKMDPNECKRSNARKRKGKVSFRWIKKTNTEFRSPNPRKELSNVIPKEAVVRSRREKPSTRLRSGKIARPQYFNGHEEVENIQYDDSEELERGRDQRAEKKQLRNAKRETESELAEFKSEARKVLKTQTNSGKMVTKEERQGEIAEKGSDIEIEKPKTSSSPARAEATDELPIAKLDSVATTTDESSAGTKKEALEGLASKIHGMVQSAGTPLGFIPGTGMFLPTARPSASREGSAFQLPLGTAPLGGMYNPLEQLLLLKNFQLQSMMGLNAGQPNLGNEMLLNLIRMGQMNALSMPLNVPLMSFPSALPKKFF